MTIDISNPSLSSSFTVSSNDASCFANQKYNNKTFIQKKKNVNSNNLSSIELPNGEIIEIPPSLEDVNLDEIYSPIVFCQEMVNEALNEIIELLPKLNDNNLKLGK